MVDIQVVSCGSILVEVTLKAMECTFSKLASLPPRLLKSSHETIE